MMIKDFKAGHGAFIKRKCRGKYYVRGTQGMQGVYKEFENGTFLGFGIDFEEFENGAVQYTTAIVELNDGQVIVTAPENIQFTGVVGGVCCSQ